MSGGAIRTEDESNRLGAAAGYLHGKSDDLYQFTKPLFFTAVLWEVVAQSGLVSKQALPHIYTVATTFAELAADGTMYQPAMTTFSRAIAALFISIGLGIVIGLAMARSGIVEWFFDPLISIGFPLPKATLVPLYILWFGFGTVPAVLLAVTAAVFPVIIATHSGAKGVDRELIWSVRSMGVSRLAATWKVIFPAALPQIFNGIQIAVFLSFVLTLVTEMVTSGGGIGKSLVVSVRFFRTPEALSFLFVAIAMGVFTDRVFRIVRARILQWQA